MKNNILIKKSDAIEELIKKHNLDDFLKDNVKKAIKYKDEKIKEHNNIIKDFFDPKDLNEIKYYISQLEELLKNPKVKQIVEKAKIKFSKLSELEKLKQEINELKTRKKSVSELKKELKKELFIEDKDFNLYKKLEEKAREKKEVVLEQLKSLEKIQIKNMEYTKQIEYMYNELVYTFLETLTPGDLLSKLKELFSKIKQGYKIEDFENIYFNLKLYSLDIQDRTRDIDGIVDRYIKNLKTKEGNIKSIILKELQAIKKICDNKTLLEDYLKHPEEYQELVKKIFPGLIKEDNPINPIKKLKTGFFIKTPILKKIFTSLINENKPFTVLSLEEFKTLLIDETVHNISGAVEKYNIIKRTVTEENLNEYIKKFIGIIDEDDPLEINELLSKTLTYKALSEKYKKYSYLEEYYHNLVSLGYIIRDLEVNYNLLAASQLEEYFVTPQYTPPPVNILSSDEEQENRYYSWYWLRNFVVEFTEYLLWKKLVKFIDPKMLIPEINNRITFLKQKESEFDKHYNFYRKIYDYYVNQKKFFDKNKLENDAFLLIQHTLDLTSDIHHFDDIKNFYKNRELQIAHSNVYDNIEIINSIPHLGSERKTFVEAAKDIKRIIAEKLLYLQEKEEDFYHIVNNNLIVVKEPSFQIVLAIKENPKKNKDMQLYILSILPSNIDLTNQEHLKEKELLLEACNKELGKTIHNFYYI